MKISRIKVSVKVRNSQATMAVKSEGVVARVRMKGPLLVEFVVAMLEWACGGNMGREYHSGLCRS